jgi:hypothetical protein
VDSGSSRQGRPAQHAGSRFGALLSIAVAVFAIGMLCAAPGAMAAKVSVAGNTLSIAPTGGENNAIVVDRAADGLTLTVTDTGGPPQSDGTCSVDGSTASCPAAGVTRLSINLGAGDDSLAVRPDIHARIVCGSGSDAVVAHPQDNVATDCESFDDGVAPDTTITDGPPAVLNPDRTPASFSFTATEANSSFACRLDGGTPFSCSPPTAIGGLLEGSHTFSVAAVDQFGNTDQSEASRSFTVDKTPPQTAFSAAPPARTGANPVFHLASSEAGSTFQCRVDSEPEHPCGETAAAGPLDSGAHTFHARALDVAGNADPTGVSAEFLVDLTAPNTSITSGPGDSTEDSTPTFGLSSSESPATFICQIDEGAIIECADPFSTPELAAGAHTFRAWSVDAAGNIDQTGAIRRFTVSVSARPQGTEPPPVVIVLGSVVLISGRTAKMSHSGVVPVSLICAGKQVCKGTLALSTADPVRITARKIASLGKKKFRIGAQHKKRIRMRLGKRGRKLVRRLHRVRVRATIREIDLKGHPRISMRVFTLRSR